MIQKFLKWLSYWYFRYELVTCLYMFEPWEKILLNSVIISILTLMTYSTYVYLPRYLMSWLLSTGLLEEDFIANLFLPNSRWVTFGGKQYDSYVSCGLDYLPVNH